MDGADVIASVEITVEIIVAAELAAQAPAGIIPVAAEIIPVVIPVEITLVEATGLTASTAGVMRLATLPVMTMAFGMVFGPAAIIAQFPLPLLKAVVALTAVAAVAAGKH